MLATRRVSRPGSWRSATRHLRRNNPLSSRSDRSTTEPAYRVMAVGSCARMETRTAGGLSATVAVDETTDGCEYTYGWFRESPLNLDGLPMTFFCTVPERATYENDEQGVQLHFREITGTVRRHSHRNDLHRYFDLVLRAPRRVFDPLTRVWENRWQVIGHTRPIPVPPPLRFQTIIQQMEVINGRQCLIIFFHYTPDTAWSSVDGQMENSTGQQPQQTPQPSHAQQFEAQWQGNFNSREDSSGILDDDMERIIAGIRNIL